MVGVPFRIPNNASLVYDPGPQPYNPGRSYMPWAGHWLGDSNAPKPWPTMVGVINPNIGNPGVARNRAPLPVVNRYSPNPQNYLFIGGIVGKTQG